jgi:hypothetical protein
MPAADSRTELLQRAEVVARTHRERCDGTGYPAGLIPQVGRVCAICDVFDALASARPYKEPRPVSEALAEIAAPARAPARPRARRRVPRAVAGGRAAGARGRAGRGGALNPRLGSL